MPDLSAGWCLDIKTTSMKPMMMNAPRKSIHAEVGADTDVHTDSDTDSRYDSVRGTAGPSLRLGARGASARELE